MHQEPSACNIFGKHPIGQMTLRKLADELQAALLYLALITALWDWCAVWAAGELRP